MASFSAAMKILDATLNAEAKIFNNDSWNPAFGGFSTYSKTNLHSPGTAVSSDCC